MSAPSPLLLTVLFIAANAFSLQAGEIIFNELSMELSGKEELLEDSRLSLDVEIMAQSIDEAILYGSLRDLPGTVQSILLLTKDGGHTWREAMKPQYGSRVVALSWRERQWAYAAIDWAIEGPGWELSLFVSSDGGSNWKKLSTIKKPYYWYQVEGFSFSGNLGFVHLFCDITEMLPPGRGSHQSYITKDRGMTWIEKSSRFKDPSPLVHRASLAEDGSLWWLEQKRWSSSLLIKREDPRDGKIRSIHLPKYYTLRDGRVQAID